MSGELGQRQRTEIDEGREALYIGAVGSVASVGRNLFAHACQNRRDALSGLRAPFVDRDERMPSINDVKVGGDKDKDKKK